MKRLSWTCILVISLSLLWTNSALAISLDFMPNAQTVGLGDPVTVDVVISELMGEIVAAFDLDVTYDDTVLSATGITFGPFLGDLDPTMFETITNVDVTTSGLVDFAELSLLSDADLAALQPDDRFLLATLSFDAIGFGTSSLDFVFDEFNDLTGERSAVLAIVDGSGSVNVVPEPATMLLFGSGLLSLLGLRSRFKRG